MNYYCCKTAIIMLICGVLHLSSKTIYGITKKKLPIRKFTSGDKQYFVPTKKSYQPQDMYVVIRTVSDDTGSIDRYIGNVGDYETEFQYLNIMCTLHWANNKNITV